MMNNLLQKGLFWPASLLAAALFALAIGAQFYFAAEADHSAAQREQNLLENGVASRINELAHRTVSETTWDDAVLNLDNVFDPQWAEDNIGIYFAQLEGFEDALVLDRADQPIYAMDDGETVPVASLQSLQRAAVGVIRSTRARERERGPLQPILARAGVISEPILSSALVLIDDRPFVITATLVQPDFGVTLPLTEQAPIVVTAEAVDADFLALLSQRFLLRDAHLHAAHEAVENGRARVALRDVENQTIAAVDWLPQRPGTALLARSLPLSLITLALLGCLAWRLYCRGRRAAEGLIASEARASHIAYHDALTSLPNRLLLADRLERALERVRQENEPFAVHCVDLDRFKEVNDTFGHHAGDDLIRSTARLFSSLCGPSATLARLGGDEFAIIQPGATRESAATLASQLVEVMSGGTDIAVGRVFTGCSIGVTLVETSALDAAECLRQADLALYRAKGEGRGRFTMFEAEMDAKHRMRSQIRDDLREALSRGELTLAYQPQVHNGGKMYGVEALVRWDHRERGPISPAVFVPIAEESGLIEALGAFTFRRAFEDSKRLGGLRVAVNVSAVQLRSKEFVAKLAALVEETKVNPHDIELEITEGVLLGDDPATHQILNDVRALGFRIALDDFGTGYSSLSYLQRYPIDKIKIDRSFIANLGAEANADAVVSAIVRLARALRLDVIAEGVETEIQRVRLQAAGCGDIQGFLFGRPMPLAQLETLIITHPSMTIPISDAA
jgi:diguanylate cyclase (GGDEF)-like protein